MFIALPLLESEVVTELPAPPWVFGLIAFALLISLLLITIAIGKGRTHS
jgi:hypothetical protein